MQPDNSATGLFFKTKMQFHPKKLQHFLISWNYLLCRVNSENHFLIKFMKVELKVLDAKNHLKIQKINEVIDMQ